MEPEQSMVIRRLDFSFSVSQTLTLATCMASARALDPVISEAPSFCMLRSLLCALNKFLSFKTDLYMLDQSYKELLPSGMRHYITLWTSQL